VKIADVMVKRYSAARDPQTDPGGIQIVEVTTDAGVSGRGFVSAGSDTSDLVATLIKGPLLGEEVTEEGIVLLPPDAPGLGLELDEAVAAAALVPEA
jgi:L-alanine-DL-glutamate epimerase-like enolase superfamily enzyme